MSEQPPDINPSDVKGSWGEILTGRLGIYTLLLSLGMVVFAINQFVVSTIMPTVGHDLGGMRFYAWNFSLFAVGAIVGSAASAAVRDAVGDRYAFAGAAAVVSVGLIGAALSNAMLVLVFWRLVEGLGGGVLASQCYGLVSAMFPEHLRGRVLGLVSTIWGVATVLGPGFGGVFAQFGSWRGAFWGLTPLAVAAGLLALYTVPNSPAHGKITRMPYIRLILLAGSVLLLSLTSQADTLGLRIVLVVVSIVLAVMAFRRDRIAERPMFPREVSRIGSEIGAAYMIMFLFSVVVVFINVYAPLSLQRIHGVTPLVAGYLVAIPSLTWTIVAVIVATWRGARQSAAIIGGLMLILAGVIGLALTIVSGPVWLIMVFMSVLGFGVGAMNNPNIQRAMQAAPEAERHVAGTSVQTIRTLGISFGAALAGLIAVAAGLNTDDVAPATIGTAMNWVYATDVGFAVLNLAMVIPLMAGYRRRINATV